MKNNDALVNYSTFNEIDNKLLRAYNQYNVLSNMREQGFVQLGEDYLSSLDKGDQLSLMFLVEYIKRKGYEETRREILQKAA